MSLVTTVINSKNIYWGGEEPVEFIIVNNAARCDERRYNVSQGI